MSNAGDQMYIIVVNHDRKECGAEHIVSEERATREIPNYKKMAEI